jgi:hypothetical protein
MDPEGAAESTPRAGRRCTAAACRNHWALLGPVSWEISQSARDDTG